MTTGALLRGSIVSMRIGVVALVLASCAPNPAAPAKTPRVESGAPSPGKTDPPRHPRALAPTLAAPRPEVDVSHMVPDFHDELRWPLAAMSHPSMEPQFAVAEVFAEPGVGWRELCKRGAHKRVTSGRNRDEREYLGAWCSAAAGDVDAACAALRPLMSSAVLGLAAAVRVDLANLIAGAGPSEQAEHLLSAHKLHDPQILDAVSATYVELGAEDDAYEINRLAIEVDAHASQETQCRRLIKQIVLGGAESNEISILTLKSTATAQRSSVPSCMRMYDAWRCAANPANDCGEHLYNIGASYGSSSVLRAYYNWPRGPASRDTWMRVANGLKYSLDVPASVPLLVDALDAASRVDGYCAPAVHAMVVDIERLWRLRNVTIPEDLVSVYEACK